MHNLRTDGYEVARGYFKDTRPAHQPQTYPAVKSESRSAIIPLEIDLEPDLITLCHLHLMLVMLLSSPFIKTAIPVKIGARLGMVLFGM